MKRHEKRQLEREKKKKNGNGDVIFEFISRYSGSL
jgi:hypothetical protein